MATLSLILLAVLVIVGSLAKVNLGVPAIALAGFLALGVLRKSPGELFGFFPTHLFLTLVGVTFLFAQAEVNGTLERVTHALVHRLRRHKRWIPPSFFLLSAALAAIGAGNIAAAALVAPAAMVVARRIGFSYFWMAVLVANGANAGGLSPIAPTGIIARDRMAQVGITGLSWDLFFNSLLAHTVVTFGAFLLFGRKGSGGMPEPESEEGARPSFRPAHRLTLGSIALLFLSATLFELDIALGAFAAAAFLSLFRAADETRAMVKVPWGVLLLVCGVSMLASVIESLGGLELFGDFVARWSTARTVTGWMAFAAGLLSVYSSSSGVVLPTFLLMIPALVSRLPGSDPAAIASSVSVAAHLVDVSPLSTIGALCIASVPTPELRQALFGKMLAWGLTMTAIGALLCYLLFGLPFSG